MGALRWPALVAAAVIGMPVCASQNVQVPPESMAHWRPCIVGASERFGIPVTWIERVIQAESGGHTRLHGLPIRSRAGAMGLMQLMPGTWAEARTASGLGPDPDDACDNIRAGTWYLRQMYDRYGYPGLFAAYNAGPARYNAYLATGRALPAETVNYLASVTGPVSGAPLSSRQKPAETLFALQKPVFATSAHPEDRGPASLFAVQGDAGPSARMPVRTDPAEDP